MKDSEVRKKTVLFLSAVHSETKWIEENLSEKVVTLFENEEFCFEALAVGIGNTASSINFQKHFYSRENENKGISEAIFVGAAGVYRSNDYLRTLENNVPGFSHEFVNVEISVLEGKAVLPDAMIWRCETSPGVVGRYLREKLDTLLGITNSPDSITLTQLDKDTLQKHRISFENMEVFGLASAAISCGIPFCSFFAVTNEVCESGSRQWAAQHVVITEHLQNKIISAF